VTSLLAGARGPAVMATDYIAGYSEQLRSFIPTRFVVLGTDGFGRSDTRAKLRQFFEVSREFVVLAALSALVEEGSVERDVLLTARRNLGIDPDKIDPMLA